MSVFTFLIFLLEDFLPGLFCIQGSIYKHCYSFVWKECNHIKFNSKKKKVSTINWARRSETVKHQHILPHISDSLYTSESPSRSCSNLFLCIPKYITPVILLLSSSSLCQRLSHLWENWQKQMCTCISATLLHR